MGTKVRQAGFSTHIKILQYKIFWQFQVGRNIKKAL